MKIIKEGTLPETKVYCATCNHCSCVMEFTVGEAIQVSDRNEEFLTVTCPTCQRKVWVKK